jgi:hypothetical protein
MSRPLQYIAFDRPVTVEGVDNPSMTGWDAKKHGNVRVEEKGAWLHLHTPNGLMVRVPVTNIDFIIEGKEEAAKEKAK